MKGDIMANQGQKQRKNPAESERQGMTIAARRPPTAARAAATGKTLRSAVGKVAGQRRRPPSASPRMSDSLPRSSPPTTMKTSEDQA
jgi:hypothetical protein